VHEQQGGMRRVAGGVVSEPRSGDLEDRHGLTVPR
jgi:hypothetical protein